MREKIPIRGGNQTPRRPLAEIQVNTRPLLPEAARATPAAPSEVHRILSEDRSEVLFPIRHETEGPPNAIYEPIKIPTSKFEELTVRCSTPTNFARNLLIFFFDQETRKASNFNGSRVITARGPVQKRRLDKRVVLTMLDQVELQYPGSTADRTQFSKLVDAINDKCRHS